MKKFLVFLSLFIIVAAGGAGLWYWQGQSWSKENLKLEINGPQSLKAGDEAIYVVRFKNNGNVLLEAMEFVFDFPKNAIPQDDKPSRVIQKLDDLYPGEEKTQEFKARLFGKEKETLEAKAQISFRPKGLKSNYIVDSSQATQIELVPITLEFDLPSKIDQGENFKLTLNYFSNVDYPLENLRVQVEYPDNFQFISANPQALDEKEWKVSTLGQADGGRISITGKLDDKQGARKTFRARLGVIKNGELIALKEISQALEVASANIFLSQMINGSASYTANANDYLHYEIFFKNIGKKPLEKDALLVELDGDMFDLASFRSDKGNKAEADIMILWDWKDVSSLRLLEAGEEGKVDFWIKVKDAASQKDVNAVLAVTASLTKSGVEKTFETKINSNIEIIQKAFYQDDVFGNNGPNPPEPATSTTFTIVWRVKNGWHDLTNAKVKSRLPENVSLTGKIFPETDNRLTYDTASREIIWNLGEVPAFQGQEGTTSLAFQVAVLLPQAQDANNLIIIEDSSFLAQDKATNDIVETKAKAKLASKLDDLPSQ
jgi:hypothetical protein